jgi:hypothetical protein
MDSIQDIARGETRAAGRRSGTLRQLVTLWIVGCAVVIAVGLDRTYPHVRERLAYAFRDPAMDLAKPFPTCQAAHAAGTFDIPRNSPAYVSWQDPDNDGLACETPPGGSSGRLEIIRKRLADVRP